MIEKPKITVIIPVGPDPVYKQYLPECYNSVIHQTYLPDEVYIIDDQAHITNHELWEWWGNPEIRVNRYQVPWNVGCADAFNFGVALARNECVFMMGSDDIMLPECLEDCANEYIVQDGKDGWYCVSYQVGEDVLAFPNNWAMTTKNFWNWTGGFPPSAFVGPDALLLSCLIIHAPDRILKVKEGKANIWGRQGDYQETRKHTGYFLDEMNSIRNKETLRFKPRKGIILK